MNHYSFFNYIVDPVDRLNYTKEYFSYVAEGTVKVLVHKEYPFTAEGVAQAQQDITGRGTAGKLLIKIGNERAH